MLIRKVKLAPKERAIVQAEEVDEEGDPVREVKIAPRELPTPAFFLAMQDMTRPALDMLDAAESWYDGARATGLSVNYEQDGRLGAVVTVQVPLPIANAPIVINTPHLRLGSVAENGPGKYLPPALGDAIEAMIEQARKFLDGERAQLDMVGMAEDVDRLRESAARLID